SDELGGLAGGEGQGAGRAARVGHADVGGVADGAGPGGAVGGGVADRHRIGRGSAQGDGQVQVAIRLTHDPVRGGGDLRGGDGCGAAGADGDGGGLLHEGGVEGAGQRDGEVPGGSRTGPVHNGHG